MDGPCFQRNKHISVNVFEFSEDLNTQLHLIRLYKLFILVSVKVSKKLGWGLGKG